MSRATIWDEVRDLLANDKRPTIELAAATRIVMRRAPGRPRANPVSDRFAHWQLKTPSGLPLRCRSFGCNKPLKKSATTICCSQGCSDLLRRYCEDTLAVMNETLAASDYPCYWRSSRTARPRRKAGSLVIYLSLVDPHRVLTKGACRRVKVQREGDWFDLRGESIELFRIGTLAEAFGRAVRTLKEWEQEKLLPLPLFRVHGSPHRRYSATQILNAHRLVRARWGERRHVPLTEMRTLFDVLRDVWYLPTVAVDDRGNVNETTGAYLRTA